ncbi:UDP-N-acetylmuramoyl-L-alanyl-D-glutamate--2,6-diaminopimelate ligase [Candidatus Babeliales bacterium]|nr:UDP-N-acetylmuramoyl-L-alanyl-D-glutamate--2,6-diaminopimelate ligase [Candidatus Babeliales bacterium]
MPQKLELPHFFPVTCHTKYVGLGSTFVVIKGQNTDGLRFISEALSKGATTIVVERGVPLSGCIQKEIYAAGALCKTVHNTRVALATLSAEAAGYPAQKLKLLGITGTKGKTTTAFILKHLLQSVGKKVALLSTVHNKINNTIFKAPLTTPQPDYLHQFFKLCVQEDIEYVVMETAAQATTFKRLEGLELDGLIFTNLDREHGELYPTMQSYFKAKQSLCTYLKKDAHLLVNNDDEWGKKLLKKHLGKTFGQVKANYCFELLCEYECDLNGNRFLFSTVPGLFNAYNVVAAVSLCLSLGLFLPDLEKGLLSIPKIPGRLEEYKLKKGVRAFIDYAHTPASFKALFETVQEWTDHITVVFGAGGGKDHDKRPLMGNIAGRLTNTVIVTTDNPRFEDPQIIADQIVAGIEQEDLCKVIVLLDRAAAIKKALELTPSKGVILLLGKGPDEYQIIQDQKIPFHEKLLLLGQI